ncbi:hypothetical protein GEMRC1_004437 [Eukaryota sp. GEM-RC1]
MYLNGVFSRIHDILEENTSHDTLEIASYRFKSTSISSSAIFATFSPCSFPVFRLTSCPFSSHVSKSRNIISCHSHLSHDGWCPHSSSIYIYYSLRSSWEQPQLTHLFPSCITYIAPHPQKPSVFCLGFLDGSIRIINTTKIGDPLVAVSKRSPSSKAVAFLSWFTDPVFKNVSIVVHQDGFVSLFSVKNSLSEPLAQFQLSDSGAYGSLIGDITSCQLITGQDDSQQPVFLVGFSSGLLSHFSLPLTDSSALQQIPLVSVSSFSSSISAIATSPSLRSDIAAVSFGDTVAVFENILGIRE